MDIHRAIPYVGETLDQENARKKLAPNLQSLHTLPSAIPPLLSELLIHKLDRDIVILQSIIQMLNKHSLLVTEWISLATIRLDFISIVIAELVWLVREELKPD